MMIDGKWAYAFAEEWITAWNSHDIGRILSHYADDFMMTSPLIVERMGEASGTLSGKDAIGPYWQIGLDANPPLRFELINVFAGVDSVVIHYRRTNGDLAAELFIFDGDRRVVRSIAHHAS